MKLIADTNVLVRVIVNDDKAQAEAARKLLHGASLIAVSPTCFCELFWVLSRSYGLEKSRIAGAFRTLLSAENVVTHESAVEAGLTMLEAGGDFADGVIDYEGSWLGGETFVSFDRKAVEVLTRQGRAARVPD